MKFKIIDLFAGIGGIRLGFEKAAKKKLIETNCVFSSEIDIALFFVQLVLGHLLVKF